jgi:hypothetical protein
MAVLAPTKIRLSHCILDQCSTSRFAMCIDSFLENMERTKSTSPTRGLELQRQEKIALVLPPFPLQLAYSLYTAVIVLFQHHSGSEQ